MRDIVHIGYPRTATSWFQHNIFSTIQNYTFIPRKIVQDNLIHPLPGRYNPDWNNIYQKEGKPFIISEEMISGKIRAGSVNLHFLETYSHRIKESFNNPLILVFLRNQPDAIFSFYNLYIKKGGTFSLVQFLRQDLQLQESLLFSKMFFCYDLSLKILSDVFGKESVKIYCYEDFALNPQEFLKRFCIELDLKLDLAHLNFLKSNSGYTSLKLEAKRLANRFSSQGIPFKHYFVNLPYAYGLFKHGSKKETPLPKVFLKEMEAFMHEFVESNKKLISDYNLIEIKKFKYPL